MVHRHEIPVPSTPVKILHRDDEHGFIVIDKPGSIVSPISTSFTSPGYVLIME